MGTETMARPLPPPPPSAPTTSNARQPTQLKAARLSKKAATKYGSATILYGVEGWGKTSLAAHRDGAAFILAPQETGYLMLRQNGLVPECPTVQPDSWLQLLAEVDALIADPQGIGMLAIDAIGGMERMCHEYVCQTEFGGDWSNPRDGFISYGKGYDVALKDWLMLLSRLDTFRFKHGIPVMMLGHSKVQNFKNPTGPDFDRYMCDCNPKTWGVTHKWADHVFFGNFIDVVAKEKGERRNKGIGGNTRVVFTERTAAFDAKNRLNLPSEIDIPNDHTAGFRTLAEAMTRKAGA